MSITFSNTGHHRVLIRGINNKSKLGNVSFCYVLKVWHWSKYLTWLAWYMSMQSGILLSDNAKGFQFPSPTLFDVSMMGLRLMINNVSLRNESILMNWLASYEGCVTYMLLSLKKVGLKLLNQVLMFVCANKLVKIEQKQHIKLGWPIFHI